MENEYNDLYNSWTHMLQLLYDEKKQYFCSIKKSSPKEFWQDVLSNDFVNVRLKRMLNSALTIPYSSSQGFIHIFF